MLSWAKLGRCNRVAFKAESIYYLTLYTKSLLISAADHMKAVILSDLCISARMPGALLSLTNSKILLHVKKKNERLYSYFYSHCSKFGTSCKFYSSTAKINPTRLIKFFLAVHIRVFFFFK